ncbi:MAG: hypothetical protein A2934_04425 [Candidatus Sungbacteria bacterium RIFCSPLOWO2_01_FULL_47_10]|uniref:Uncharacterized protein n=1 Tax=Candidatus Sungbacteria bacterium RIFCSPLOWO2_01_FULL_47_10 TaxID=1802276 RepID=A0A1G2L4S8_9BACT|nr:MAG: hypothetical protein A2934_04425 [Candidatus Sungbacteria bacterium RIFCSPLOWO2_01_FULL_47_10]
MSAKKFAKLKRGRGGRGVQGGNSAAPERSAGAKRRRSVPFKIGSDLVKQTHQYNKRLIAMSRLLYWCLYCTKLALIFKTNDVPRPSENSRYTH